MPVIVLCAKRDVWEIRHKEPNYKEHNLIWWTKQKKTIYQCWLKLSEDTK